MMMRVLRLFPLSLFLFSVLCSAGTLRGGQYDSVEDSDNTLDLVRQEDVAVIETDLPSKRRRLTVVNADMVAVPARFTNYNFHTLWDNTRSNFLPASVATLLVDVKADDTKVEIELTGSMVSQTIKKNMIFIGNIKRADGTKLWEYRIDLRFTAQSIELNKSWVKHVVTPASHTDPAVAKTRIPIALMVKIGQAADQTATDKKLCYQHNKSNDATKKHWDCREVSKLSIDTSSRGPPPSIDTFSFKFKASHETTLVYAEGEPHFLTWGGFAFDYHGECDLVFLSTSDFASGLGLDIHIRTRIRYNYSFIESAAIKIGDNVLEVSTFGMYMLDGISNADLDEAVLSTFPLTHKQVSDKQHRFEIEVGGGNSIVISTMKDIVSVKINPNKHDEESADKFIAWFMNSTGLVGSISSDKLLARDGVTVVEEPNDYGQEWQRRDSDPKLFLVEDRAPQYPQKCILPSLSHSSESRRLVGTASHDAAVAACDEWPEDEKENCIYDVLATGDFELAEAGAY